MITKDDCIILLSQLQNEKIDVKAQILKTVRNEYVQSDVVQFINKHRQMDLCMFYEKLRKSYNEKRSKLYLNIVRDLNEDSVQEVLTTLASLSLQILLFRPKAENMELFIRASRLDEINKVILHYTNTYDIIPAIKLLRIIKADLKCLEASLK